MRSLDKFIFRIEVREETYPDKLNWLSDINIGKYRDEIISENRYEIYFPSFELMSLKIDEITNGFHRHWGDASKDIYGNDNEWIEFYNGKEKWDKGLFIDTSRVYLIGSLLNSIDQVT